MKERPILFSAPKVQAILEGRKTQTRRIIQQKHLEWVNNSVENFLAGCWDQRPMPYGKPGDKLWVKETWMHGNWPDGRYDQDCPVFYRADYFDDPHGPDGEKSPEGEYRKWIPSIFMPRAASRILLEITDVRVERLQEISEADAEAEGIERSHHGNGDQWINYPKGSSAAGWIYPRDSYRSLWNSINGAGSWDENPYVWVIGFKRVLS